MYGFYLWVVWRNARTRKGEKKGARWLVWEEKRVENAGLAVVVMFAASVMTVSKTWLYGEFFPFPFFLSFFYGASSSSGTPCSMV